MLETTPGLAVAQLLTHLEAFEWDDLPECLFMLAGDCIGLELSLPMQRFGSRVMVIECNDWLVHLEDEDAAEGLRSLF